MTNPPAPVILDGGYFYAGHPLAWRVGWIVGTDLRTGWPLVQLARIGRERTRKTQPRPAHTLAPWTKANEALLRQHGKWRDPKDTAPVLPEETPTDAFPHDHAP